MLFLQYLHKPNIALSYPTFVIMLCHVMSCFMCLQLLLDCSELESRLSEKINLLNTDDYGKDHLATQSLITKHQVTAALTAENPPEQNCECVSCTCYFHRY